MVCALNWSNMTRLRNGQSNRLDAKIYDVYVYAWCDGQRSVVQVKEWRDVFAGKQNMSHTKAYDTIRSGINGNGNKTMKRGK